MKKFISAFLFSSQILLLPSLALAADCAQENALYEDGFGFTLSFERSPYKSFTYLITLKNSESEFTGLVSYSSDNQTPYVDLWIDCLREEDKLACGEEIYDGEIYSFDDPEAGYGETPRLPLPGQKASLKIAFPFASQHYHMAYDGGLITSAPGERFKLKGCK